MKIKRFFLIVISIVMLLVFVACDADKEPAVTATPEVTLAPTDTPEPTEEPTPSPEPTPVATIEPGTEQYAEGIKDAEKGKKVYLDAEDPGLIGATHINPGSSASIQFFPTTTFDRVWVRLATYTQTSGHSVEISLYRWQGTYDLTLESEAVFVGNYADYKDNIWLEVVFGEEFVDGEYLVDVYNDSDANHVGIWFSKEEDIMQRLYVDDFVFEEGIGQFAVGYTKTPNKEYGPLSDPGI